MPEVGFDTGLATLLVESIGWSLLHFLWQGAAIAAVYALARLLLQRSAPQLRLWTGYLALLALAMAPLLTFASHFLQGHAGAVQLPAAAAHASARATAAVADSSGGIPTLIDAALPWLVAAWLLGVLALSVRRLRQWRALRRLCAVALPADAHWQERLDLLAARMGIARAVQLRESALVLAPMLVGWLKPVVLLPASLCTRLPADQVELLLAHELAHVRRLDYLANLVQMALETVLFYHPAVHWISRCVRDDREQCCDDLVTGESGKGNRLAYARALLTLAEHHVELQRSPALAATGGALLARIERIVDAPRSAAPAAASTPLLLIAGSVLLAAIGTRALAPEWRADAAPVAPLPALALGGGVGLPEFGMAVADLFDASRPVLPALLRVQAEPASVATASGAPAADPVTPVALPGLAAPEPAVAEWLPSVYPPALQAAPASASDAPQPQASDPVAAAQPAPTRAALQAEDDGIAPLSVRAPEYPRRARIAGLEGYVTLSYSIRADGRVAGVRVDDASPSRVFDRAAREALEAWRFPVGSGAGERLQQTFDFRLEPEAGTSGGCVVSTGSRLCLPRP